MQNGNIVRGLDGVPDKGPVILVGSHMLLGTEISSLVQEFLIKKNIMVHGMAYREIFNPELEHPFKIFSLLDIFKVFGALPVSTRNICKVLSSDSHVLLYPGGLREALHRKVFSCSSHLIRLMIQVKYLLKWFLVYTLVSLFIILNYVIFCHMLLTI